MSTLVLTLLIAFVLTIIAFGLLGLSLMMTGKHSVILRRCGRDPTKEKSKEEGCDTGGTCSVCGKSDKEA